MKKKTVKSKPKLKVGEASKAKKITKEDAKKIKGGSFRNRAIPHAGWQ